MQQGSQALLNGKPIVALAVYLLPGARPQQVSAAIRTKLAELRPSLAKGVDADVSFDFTSNPAPANRPATPQHLLLDLVVPGDALAERTLKALMRCQTLLHDVAGVQDILALSENPLDAFPARPCLVVRLAPAGKTSPWPGESRRDHPLPACSRGGGDRAARAICRLRAVSARRLPGRDGH